MSSLFLDLEQYPDKDSRAIAELGAAANQLGAAWTFIQNKRTLEEFQQYLRANRLFNKATSPRKWSIEPY